MLTSERVRRRLLLFAVLCAACGDDDGMNPSRLYLKATEITLVIELVPQEPEPY